MPPNTKSPSAVVTETVREQLLECLFQHRAATTAQLQGMLFPAPHPEYLRETLRRLRKASLAESHVRRNHPSIWALTPTGRGFVGNWPQFRDRPSYSFSLRHARSAHTLVVTRTAMAFIEDARARRDEARPLDWTPEVAHPLHDGAADGDRMLIADALLRYTRTSPTRALLRAFVEVDRATESSERLASKVIAYARFHSHAPVTGRRTVSDATGLLAWQRTYPVFPRLLFVLTGAGPRALSHRVADLRAMVSEHPLTERFVDEVPTGAAVLEEMEERGPSAPVWWPLDGRPGRCSWMEL
ncbi:replication-relaxation family protein [Streptomyces sp. NEAU-S7GS2]|uniref:replication-relaxation family protein n=1 Tax=Streptomyces sp. NEAU-S7GS2 TaxID=2202000 RepID=UPI000D6F4B4D|nr:replication-relaxation family protein [Streptomyces sp. NEAU-S7GS2]AWN24782.1 hypothetical protein DKG71_00050 [Streptomyces sp. NEAU-S7GS2]